MIAASKLLGELVVQRHRTARSRVKSSELSASVTARARSPVFAMGVPSCWGALFKGRSRWAAEGQELLGKPRLMPPSDGSGQRVVMTLPWV
ncbi:hypothetical protein SHIRM173S_09307 [Streptomyces hirsutus]